MESLLRRLALHLLAASSVVLAVAVALAGVSLLPEWVSLSPVAEASIRAAVPVLAAVTLAAYVVAFVATLRTYLRGRTPGGAGSSHPPPGLAVVAPALWKGAGGAFGAFVVLLGTGLLVGVPARIFPAGQLTHDVFAWLERAVSTLGAAILVFGLALMATHSLRAILARFHFEMHRMRRVERRPDLPFEVALAALPVFAVLLVAELR